MRLSCRAPMAFRAHFRARPFFTRSLILTLLVTAGCMSSRREEELQRSLRSLEVKVGDVEKQLHMRDKNLDVVKNTTEDANRKVQSTKSDMDELRRQLSMTQGAIDELRVKMTRLQESGASKNSASVNEENVSASKAESDDALAQLERRLTRLELTMTPLVEQTSKDAKPKVSVKYKSAAEVSKLLGGAYVGKDYKKVILLATQLLASSAPSDQQEVAIEYRAEAFFQMQNYDKAALDFTEFLQRFPKSERRPRALLLCGDSFVYLKQLRSAKSYYSECVKNFPDRDECKASKERLDKLGV